MNLDDYYHSIPDEWKGETPNGWAFVTEADTGGSYEFEITRVIRNVETGELRYGYDSGCSCPSPFEGQKPEDFKVLTRETFDQFVADVKEEHRYDGKYRTMYDRETIEDFIIKVGKMLTE